MTERQVPPGIYVVEFDSQPIQSRWVVIAMTGSEAAAIVADRVMPTSTLDRKKVWADTLDVARLGTYDPGMKGSRFGAVVAQGWV